MCFFYEHRDNFKDGNGEEQLFNDEIFEDDLLGALNGRKNLEECRMKLFVVDQGLLRNKSYVLAQLERAGAENTDRRVDGEEDLYENENQTVANQSSLSFSD